MPRNLSPTLADPESTPADPVPDLLRGLLVELRGLREDLRPRRCSVNDTAILTMLLPGIAGQYGSDAWRVSGLLNDPIFSDLSGSLSPSALGALLARAAAEREVFAGYCVERLEVRHGARAWRVVLAG